MAGLHLIAEGVPTGGGEWFWPSLALGGLGLAALAVWAVLRLVREVGRAGTAMTHAAGDSAVRVAESLALAFRSHLNLDPRVRVDGVTLEEGQVPARELVMAKQVLTRTHQWTHTRLWSTKKVALTATFRISAGFDFTQPIEIRVERDGEVADVEWPAPRILSVQIEALQPADEEAGWWNRITPEDRAAVQTEMQQFVERDAAESGLLARAEAELRQLLQEQTRPAGSHLRVHFAERPALPAATEIRVES